jgi:hypothetical protein
MYVHERTSDGGAPIVSRAAPGEPHFDYLPLTIGVIRDYRVYIGLYGFSDDERLDPAVREDTALHASASIIVATSGDDAASLATAKRLASFPRRAPYAVLGSARLAAEWTRIMGTPPVFARAVTSAELHAGVGVFDTLKAVTKQILTELKQ